MGVAYKNLSMKSDFSSMPPSGSGFFSECGAFCVDLNLNVIFQVFYLFIQNGNVYMAAKLACKQMAKSEENILDLYFLVTYFETDIMYCYYCTSV